SLSTLYPSPALFRYLVYRQIGDGHVDAAAGGRLDKIVDRLEFDIAERPAEPAGKFLPKFHGHAGKASMLLHHERRIDEDADLQRLWRLLGQSRSLRREQRQEQDQRDGRAERFSHAHGFADPLFYTRPAT